MTEAQLIHEGWDNWHMPMQLLAWIPRMYDHQTPDEIRQGLRDAVRSVNIDRSPLPYWTNAKHQPVINPETMTKHHAPSE